MPTTPSGGIDSRYFMMARMVLPWATRITFLLFCNEGRIAVFQYVITRRPY